MALVIGTIVVMVGQTNGSLAEQTTHSSNPQGQLTPAQVQHLKRLGLRIAAPAYVPAGFWVSSVKIRPGKAPGRPGYLINYRGPNGTCFAIHSGRGGSGYPLAIGYQQFPINASFPGYGTIYYRQAINSSRNALTLFSRPIEAQDGRWYAFQGAGGEMGQCNNISPQEAVRIMESLRYLP